MNAIREFIDVILQNPWINFTVLAVGLIGSAFTIYDRKRNPFSKGISYCLRGINIIDQKAEDIDHLEIRFKVRKINALSETTVLFWNSGNTAIQSTDFTALSTIALQVPEGHEVLGTSPPLTDGAGVDISISQEIGARLLPISVGLIERGRGALIKVWHTSPNPKDLRLQGSITDFGAPVRKLRIFSLKRILDLLAYSVALFILVGLIANTIRVFEGQGIGSAILSFLLLGAIGVVLFSALVWSLAKVCVRMARFLWRPSLWEFEKALLGSSLVNRDSDI